MLITSVCVDKVRETTRRKYRSIHPSHFLKAEESNQYLFKIANFLTLYQPKYLVESLFKEN